MSDPEQADLAASVAEARPAVPWHRNTPREDRLRVQYSAPYTWGGRFGMHDTPPPELEKTDPRYPGNDPRYKGLTPKELPLTECLKDTVERFLPYWHETIAPAVQSGKRVIIAAHGFMRLMNSTGTS